MGDIGGHLSAKGAFIDTNNDGIIDGFAHTIKNAGNFNTFSLTNGILTVQGPTGGAAIGGSSTHVQYNQGGVFKGESNFTYNESTNTLTVDNLTVTDTLIVTTTTTLNSNTVTIGDSIIVLNSDETGAPSQNAGIEIERGTSANVQLVWDETNDQWDFDTYSLASVGKVFASGSGPIYTFTSDTDTGLEHTGTDQLGLVTGNTRVLMVSTNGVHIAPAGATGAGANQALLVDNIAIDTNTISSANTNGNIVLSPDGTGDVQVDADTLRVGDSGSDATITTNGAGDLTISTNGGTDSGYVKVEDGANNDILIIPNGTGKVGIGQLTPTEILHVNGNAIITGNLTVSGTSTTVSTTNTFVTDDILTLNSGETANGVASGAAGIEIDRGENGGVDNPIARFIFDESDDKFKTQMETGSGSGSYNAAGIVASSVEGTTGTFSGDLTVDTNVLKVDTSNNRVGVNKTPTVALDISGEVAGDGGATFEGIVQGAGILAADKSSFLVYFINNNASSTALGMPLRIDGSHATSVVQANQAQSNTLANCAVGLATGNTANGNTGRMAVSGSLTLIPASSFTGSDPSDGDAVYVSGTAGKLTVDVPSTGYVQQIGRIQDTNVSVSGNSGTATIIISIGTPILAEVYDGDAQGVTGVTGTLPIVSTGGATPAISINAATTSAAGSMSAADKTKLDGIETGADVTDATNVNAAIAGHTYTAATVAAADKVLIQDTSDSNNVKTVTASSIAALASAGDTYDLNAGSKSGASVPIQLTSGSGSDDSVINLTEGSNITLTRNSATQVTIAAAGGGGGPTAGYLTSVNGTDVHVTGYAGQGIAFAGGTPPLLAPLAAGVVSANPNDVVSGSIILMASFGGGPFIINLDHTQTWAPSAQEAFHLVFVNTDGASYVIESTGAANLTINGATTITNSTQYSATSLVITAGSPQQGFAWG